jgi:hypothetical protein
MAGDIFAFYASHSPMTDPGEVSALIEPLPNDAAALTHVIPGLGIYDVVARDFYGFEPPENRLSEIHLRPIASRASGNSMTSLCISRGSRSVARFSAAMHSRSCL